VIYLDTGCLLKLYFPESDSERIAELVTNETIRFIGLHELECRNALELKAFRKEATPAQVKATAELIENDLKAGVLHRSSPDWEGLLKQATSFSSTYSAKIGCRSLDIMHCAAAMLLGDTVFLTTDERQRKLALKVGLHCPKV
jgi:predicted nucleic acid-binding protein